MKMKMMKVVLKNKYLVLEIVLKIYNEETFKKKSTKTH